MDDVHVMTKPNLIGAVRLFAILMVLLPVSVLPQESTCFGTTSNGALEKGVRLPMQGDNFITYSRAAWLAGRTYVHSEVKEIVVGAYAALQQSHPDKVFKLSLIHI